MAFELTGRRHVFIGMLALALTGASAAAPSDGEQATNELPEKAAPRTGNSQLQTIEVQAKASSNAILPTNAEIDAAFGPNRNVLDIARSVTPISGALMRAAGIGDLRDIMKLAPDTYSPTDFGAPSLPDIRGQLGEIFEDGLRQQGGNNGFGIPLSFNALDGMSVIKGPPPVILGTTQRVGGFVDLQLKRPNLDRAAGYAEFTLGSWSHRNGQLDYSVPIESGRSGIRVSLEAEDDQSYYDYAHHRSQDVFVAYRLKPDPVSELNASFESYYVNFTDIAGINRPTQELIDKGLYITGQGVQPNGSAVPGAFAVISPTGLVAIPRHEVLTDPKDNDYVKTWIAHLRYERSLSDNVRLISRDYVQHLERFEHTNNSFTEIIKGADTAEHRTEFVVDRDTDIFAHSLHQQTDIGVDIRFNHTLGFSQFDTEADLPTDLTLPLSYRRIALTPGQQAALIQLSPGFYVSPGAQYPRNGQPNGYMISDTTDSDIYQGGLFAQHEIHFTPRWSAMAGARGDWYYVTAKDPLPPPGEVPAHDHATHLLEAGNASLTYKPLASISIYAATSYSESTSNSLGGGIALGAGNRIDPANFSTRSTLYEVGAKWGRPGAPWYSDASLFSQKRSLRNRDGSNTGIVTKGLDAQWFYQGDGLFASAGADYLSARYDGSASFQDTTQVRDAFNAARPDIIKGTGIGAPNFAAFPPSTVRVQGLPSVSGSMLVGYNFAGGLGATLAGTVSNSFPLDYLETVWIRAQYTLDSSIYYRWRQSSGEIRLTVNNLTNQRNWAPVFDGGYFGATDVFPELPANLRLTVRKGF